MEDLTTTQVILLTLFISFVTSIATGIVTVTLLEQAPVGVTQTINRVVEHTVERIVPGESKTTVKEVLVTGEDLVARVITASTPALVRITGVVDIEDEGGVTTPVEKNYTGIFVSKDGYIVSTEDIVTSVARELEVSLTNGEKHSAEVVSAGGEGVSILKIVGAPKKLSYVLLLERSPALGDQIIALGFQGKSSSVELGRITKIDDSNASTTPLLVSNLSSTWPILSLGGALLGIGHRDGRITSSLDIVPALTQATARPAVAQQPATPTQKAAVVDAVPIAPTSTPARP